MSQPTPRQAQGLLSIPSVEVCTDLPSLPDDFLRRVRDAGVCAQKVLDARANKNGAQG